MPTIMIVADQTNIPPVALQRGLELAQKLRCGVLVAAFCYESLGSQGIKDKAKQQQIQKKLLQRRRKEVEAQITAHKPGRMRVDTCVVWEKSIHNWIRAQCKRDEYAAVIKTGHRSEYFAYTPTDWHLLRECPAPIMIVAEKKWRHTKPIVAALDLGTSSRVKQKLNHDIMVTACAFAEAIGCELHVIYAIHVSPLLSDLDLVDEFSHVAEIKKRMADMVVGLSVTHSVPQKNFRMKQGAVDKVIASEAARLRAQLLIMGTVGRRGVKAKILGNTAEKVLTLLKTDVLALKP